MLNTFLGFFVQPCHWLSALKTESIRLGYVTPKDVHVFLHAYPYFVFFTLDYWHPDDKN